MSRSQETFNKKEVRNKKEKKRKEKEKKRLARKEQEKSSLDDMIAYVDENGMITNTPPDPNKKTKVNAADIEVSTPKGDNIKADPVRKGVVAFFNESKGYGFIRDSETRESIFMHINSIEEPVKEGNQVSFETEMGHKGLNAVKVKPIK
ncbi:MAG: cold shock domain-containing protein [Prolixibacteraceae bacterium]|nr:cold shock domain-containing protein [Prolixibacteraceae bacterium]